MNAVKKVARRLQKVLSNQVRDPRYIFVLIWSVPVFTLTAVQALSSGWFDSIERPVFQYINNLPQFLSIPMYLLTQLGSLGGLLLWLAVAWLLVNRRAMYSVLAGGLLGWFFAKIAKIWVHRDRPQGLLDTVRLFHNQSYSGYGFPSGHSTLSAACATILYYQVKPAWRKYILFLVFLVGISRMYLGAHFPLDVVGGWALGAVIGALVSLLAGTSRQSIPAHRIKKILKDRGMPVKSLQFFNTDARGSRPVLMEGEDGQLYFGKIFGKQEHAADWLFKIYRFFRYKNLQAEEPYVNARRNVEIEAFATMWGKKAGARVPTVVDLIRLGSSWLLIQERVVAKPLTDSKNASQKTLADAWRQVKKLHDGNIAHRDLRAANIIIDDAGKAWIIDFGFAEVAPNIRRKRMDVAELLVSMSLLYGHKQTVTAARSAYKKDELIKVLPYLQKSVFSGATLAELRKNKGALGELQEYLKNTLGVEEDVVPAKIDRLNARRIITIVVLAAFVYVVLPQFKQFSGNLDSLEHWRFGWALAAFFFSVLTYLAAALVYVVLANVPLKIRDAAAIQLASSFVSKVVPGGIGGTTLNARYLNRSGLDTPEASSIIAAQNILGFITFIIPLALILLIGGHAIGELFQIHISSKIYYAVATVAVLGVLILSSSKAIRERVKDFISKLLLNLRDLSTSPKELTLAALASFAITLCYVACLYASVHAFHGTISLISVAIVYASAMIAKSAIPTPGGLGPVEVTMAAGLLGLGMPVAPAYAAVILYRLATFWIPVPFSLLAYRYSTARRLI